MNKCIERIVNGIVKENPTFVMLIGMCPTLAVTTSAINGIGMGLSTTLVLVFSNLLISLLSKIIPDSARVPAFQRRWPLQRSPSAPRLSTADSRGSLPPCRCF